MTELSKKEYMEINGGTAATVFTGLGVAAVGVACMASATASVPLLVAGYALYEVGALVAIGGMIGG